MILELLKFLQATETELQTETEIARQKIMKFPQLLRYKHMSSILNDPVMNKNSRAQKLRSSSSMCGHFSGCFLRNVFFAIVLCHARSHSRAAMHGRVSQFIAFTMFEHVAWVFRKSMTLSTA